MKGIFKNKKLTYLFIVLALVLVILLCVLITNLTQLSSMNSAVGDIGNRIDQMIVDKGNKEELVEYIKSNEYLIDWAKEHGLLTSDQIAWINNNVK